MDKSEYYLSLSADVKLRYDKKVEIIDNIDPFNLKESELTLKADAIPRVTFMDLVTYFILSHSYYTGQQLKAFKSLEAYKYYDSGFLQLLKAKQINVNACVIIGKVKHSRRFRVKSADAWIILLADGSVSSAHCTCMAGLGEVCSHVAAVLFALHARKHEEDEPACTDELALWPIPKVSGVEMLKIKDMSWSRSSTSTKSQNVSPLEGDDLEEFKKKIQATGCSPAIARIMDPFASEMYTERETKAANTNLPAILSDLYDVQYEDKPYEELMCISDTVLISVTAEESAAVEEVTRGQSQNNSWFNFQKGRITASKLKAVCRTSSVKPSLSLIKSVCYPEKVQFFSKQTAYGILHEKDAVDSYRTLMSEKHTNMNITFVGFMISATHPELGASPDGMVSCDCCGLGCIEVKCPFTLSDATLGLVDYANVKGSCLIYKDNDLFLDKDHAYYYQIQLQMFVSQTTFCDFMVWSENNIFLERQFFDADFCEQHVTKALIFHRNIILPELLGRYFTKSGGIANVTTLCICDEPDDGRPMLQCEQEDCDKKWFHLDCVNLADIPDTLWFCNSCTALMNNI